MDIKQMFNSFKLTLIRKGPQIATIGGVGLMVGGAVWGAVNSVKKVAPILEEKKKDPEAKVTWKVVKAYAGPAACEILGGTSVLAGMNVLNKRYVASAAAYATVSTAFEAYRENVIERYGQQADTEMMTNAKCETIQIEEVDENGKKKKAKVSVMQSKGPLNGYARYFAYGDSVAAERNFDYNEMFLRGQEIAANKILVAKGYLFLNDLYEMLGFERTIAGQAVGWVYDPSREDHGDNCIKLRKQIVYRQCPDSPGEYEKVWMIDPNVDGGIMSHLVEVGLIGA